MITLSIAGIMLLGILSALATMRAGRVGDRQQEWDARQILRRREVERRYWRARYPNGHWPGKR